MWGWIPRKEMSYISGGHTVAGHASRNYHSQIDHSQLPSSLVYSSLRKSTNDYVREVKRVMFRPSVAGTFDYTAQNEIEIKIEDTNGGFLDGQRSYLTAQIEISKDSQDNYHRAKFLYGQTDWIEKITLCANKTGKILAEIRDYNRLCALHKKFYGTKDKNRTSGWLTGGSDDASGNQGSMNQYGAKPGDPMEYGAPIALVNEGGNLEVGQVYEVVAHETAAVAVAELVAAKFSEILGLDANTNDDNGTLAKAQLFTGRLLKCTAVGNVANSATTVRLVKYAADTAFTTVESTNNYDKMPIAKNLGVAGGRDLEWTELIRGERYVITYHDNPVCASYDDGKGKGLVSGGYDFAACHPDRFIAVLAALMEEPVTRTEFGAARTSANKAWWRHTNCIKGLEFTAKATGAGFAHATYPTNNAKPIGILRDAMLAWTTNNDGTWTQKAGQLFGKMRFRRVSRRRDGLEENLFKAGTQNMLQLQPGASGDGSFQVEVDLSYFSLLNHTKLIPITNIGGFRLKIKLAAPPTCLVSHHPSGCLKHIPNLETLKYTVSNVKYQASMVYMTEPYLRNFNQAVLRNFSIPYSDWTMSTHVPRSTADTIRVASNIQYVQAAFITFRPAGHTYNEHRNSLGNCVNGGVKEVQYASGGMRFPMVPQKLVQSAVTGDGILTDGHQPEPTVEAVLECKKAWATIHRGIACDKIYKSFICPPRIYYSTDKAAGNTGPQTHSVTAAGWPQSHANSRVVTNAANEDSTLAARDGNVGTAAREHWDGSYVIAQDFSFKNSLFSSMFNRVNSANKGTVALSGNGADLYVTLNYGTDPSNYNLEMTHWIHYDNALIIRANGDLTVLQTSY